MFIVREVLHCKPGKVRQMVEKFRIISAALADLGHRPLRLMTDVSGEHFWTVVAEAQVDSIDQFVGVDTQLMANDTVRQAMADYHDLVESGRREVYRVEA
jgi:hypothetical protein